MLLVQKLLTFYAMSTKTKARQLVAWNLRRLRATRNISQVALSVSASVDHSYINRREHALENPTIDLLERLAVALGTDVAELFQPPKGKVPASAAQRQKAS